MLLVGAASFAQDADPPARPQKERMTPEERNERQLKKLTSELSLDANQQVQVKQLLADRSAKTEKLREERKAKKDSNVKPTAEERAAVKKQMEDEVAANDTKMKSILKADQYTKWKTLQQEKKDKMMDRMKDRRDENQ